MTDHVGKAFVQLFEAIDDSEALVAQYSPQVKKPVDPRPSQQAPLMLEAEDVSIELDFPHDVEGMKVTFLQKLLVGIVSARNREHA